MCGYRDNTEGQEVITSKQNEKKWEKVERQNFMKSIGMPYERRRNQD